MANTISIKKIVDGQRKYVVEVDILGDGTGEEAATVVVDFSDLEAVVRQVALTVSIEKIIWSFTGFSATVLWDATTPVRAFECNENNGGFDFKTLGGPQINPKATGFTGDIVFTTVGLGDGDHGYIRFEGYKKQ